MARYSEGDATAIYENSSGAPLEAGGQSARRTKHGKIPLHPRLRPAS